MRIFLGILILVSLAGALDSYWRTPVILVIPLLGAVCWVLASRLAQMERRILELEGRLRKRLDALDAIDAIDTNAARVSPPRSGASAPSRPPVQPAAAGEEFVFSVQDADASGSDAVPAGADAAAPSVPPLWPQTGGEQGASRVVRQPQPPGWAENALRTLWGWFAGGNPVVKAGLVVLFFGVSFLLKYASDHSLLPMELRMAGAGLLGVALLVLGWRLRRGNPVYALLVQGGGVGVLYLTIFASARFAGMVPPAWALVLMTGVVAFSGVLAVIQNSMALAFFGAAGGFLAPILVSTGQGSHVHLFAYYALLNLGVLGIAVHRTWRPLNLLGFACTFGIGAVWGARYYVPEHFATTEPFLVLFFVMYSLVSFLFARTARENPRLDSALVFGLPLAAFSLQMGLVRDMEMGGAYSCLGLALWYLLPLRFVRGSGEKGGGLALLAEAHLALGVIFVSLAVPMALDATWTASTWALEGAGMVWLGLRQQRLVTRAFGLLLQVGAALAFARSLAGADMQMSDGLLLAGLFLGAGGLASAWSWWAFPEAGSPRERHLPLAAGVWGAFWWYGALFFRFAPRDQTELLVAATASLGMWTLLQHRSQWPWPGRLAQMSPGIMLAVAAIWSGHPAAGHGWLVWPLALAALFAAMRFAEAGWEESWRGWSHTAAGLLVCLLFVLETHWQVFHWQVSGALRAASWAEAALALSLVVLLLAAAFPVLGWPLRRHHAAYLRAAAVPAFGACLWWLGAASAGGDPHPLPYVPVLNPLDLAQAMVPAALALWAREADRAGAFGPATFGGRLTAFLAAAGFAWVNVVLARTVHFFGGVPYSLHSLFASGVMQASCSVVWSVSALGAMLAGWRLARRRMWLAGAVLVAVVVAKLFLVDLDGRGSVARIVSFLGVGLLMLVMGYFCPLPPKEVR